MTITHEQTAQLRRFTQGLALFGGTDDDADTRPATAPDILIAGADAISARADMRDTPAGERVMRRTVAMFNAWRSGDSIHDVTEAEGWVFMALVKLCRANAGGHNLDDYVDGAAYVALAGEHADRLDESAY